MTSSKRPPLLLPQDRKTAGPVPPACAFLGGVSRMLQGLLRRYPATTCPVPSGTAIPPESGPCPPELSAVPAKGKLPRSALPMPAVLPCRASDSRPVPAVNMDCTKHGPLRRGTSSQREDGTMGQIGAGSEIDRGGFPSKGTRPPKPLPSPRRWTGRRCRSGRPPRRCSASESRRLRIADGARRVPCPPSVRARWRGNCCGRLSPACRRRDRS